MRREPLFDWNDVSDSGRVDPEIMLLLEEEGPPEADDVDVYDGRRVRWLGEEGRMLKVGWDRLHALAGNIFDADKVVTMIAYARNQDDKPVWKAPPAWVDSHGVSIQDIEESQQAFERGEIEASYGMTRPYSTGDDDLDVYIRDRRNILHQLAKCKAEDCEFDSERDELQELVDRMEPEIEEAVRLGSGDLGKVMVQLRDGHHRAAMAYAMGEPWIWVYVPRTYEGALAGNLE
jgi:hypothetical protein